MKVKTAFKAFIVPASALAVLCSCGTETIPDHWHINAATDYLDDVQKSQNYWGRISASSPHWIPNTNQFKVVFSEDPTNYAAAARTNVAGGQAMSTETALFAGLVGQSTFIPPISTGAAPLTTPTNPQPLFQLPNQAQMALSSFSPLFSLAGQAPAPDERQVVNKAINDKIAEQILLLMANPTFDSNQERVLFGLMQVTCQPGPHTRAGYVADLGVTLKYGHLTNYTRTTKTHTLGSGTTTTTNDAVVYENPDSWPTVLAVLPLIDSENVQLQQSDRSQVEMAAALSAAFAAKGLTAAAQSLADYVKRQQSDVGTRNSLPVVTTYSTKSTFGFQVYPSLQAVENPGSGKSKSGNILQPITFPAVVVLKINQSEISQSGSPEDTNYPWNLLVTESRSHWVRIRAPFWYPLFGHQFFGLDDPVFPGMNDPVNLLLLPQYGSLLPSTASLHEDLWQARELDKAHEHVEKLKSHQAYFENQYVALKAAYDQLKDTSFTLRDGEYFNPKELFKPPDTNGPAISDVFPHLVWRDADTTFTILGSHLDGCDTLDIAGMLFSNNQVHIVNHVSTVTNWVINTNLTLAGMLDTNLSITKFLSMDRPLTNILLPNLAVSNLLSHSVSLDHIVGTDIDLVSILNTNLTLAKLFAPAGGLGKALTKKTLGSILGTNSDKTLQSLAGTTDEALALNLALSDVLRTKETLANILGAKVTVGEVLRRDATLGEVLRQGITLGDILAAGKPLNSILDTTKTLRDLLGDNATLGQILRHGATLGDILAPNLTFGDILGTNATLGELLGSNAMHMQVVTKMKVEVTNDQVIYVTVPSKAFTSLTNATNSIDFVAFGPKGHATKTLALPMIGEATSDAVVTLTRDPNSSKVTGFDLKRGEGVSEADLLNTLRGVLEKSEAATNTVIINH